MTVRLTKIGCMVPMNENPCRRPVQYVFDGEQGPYYRCGKHGMELMRHRHDVEVEEYELGEHSE